MSESQGVVFEWVGHSSLTDDIPQPAAACDLIPEWYESLPSRTDGGATVKLCGPFGDALRTGWIIPLPFDLNITRNEDTISSSISGSDVEPTVYGPSTAELDKNSTFRKPELKIPNPWKIHTPDGYSTLITYPRNREDDGIKPYSMLVDTDSYDGRINIPVSTTQDQVEIPSGAPFVHVIPLERDSLLSDFETTDETESPTIKEMWYETHLRSLLENGYYRNYCWVPKEAASVEDTTETAMNLTEFTDAFIRALVTADEELQPAPAPAHTPKAFTLDDLSGIIPEPVPNGGVLPMWVTDPAELGIDGEDERRFRSWAHDVMQLGWNMPQVAGMRIRVEGGDIELKSEFPERFERGDWHWSGGGEVHPAQQTGEKYTSSRPGVGKLRSPWFTLTPPGYSLFVSEPFNHRQQFVNSYTGIVDSDRFVVDGNILGKIDLPDGEYRIEPGEPTLTQIPFRRDSMLKQAYIVDQGNTGNCDFHRSRQ